MDSLRVALPAAVLLASVAGTPLEAAPPPARGASVRWIPIDDGPQAFQGMIDSWMSYFVRRNIEQAQQEGAKIIIFAIRTYGGEIRAAVEIVNAIYAADPILTVAYVDGRAISAGALIALACDRVYMKTGSTMGAAQAVTIGSDGKPVPVGEKVDAFMRAVFRSVAEKRVKKVSPEFGEAFIALAEAMTDPEVVVLRVEVDGKVTFVRETEFNEFMRQQEKAGKTVSVQEEVVRKGELLTVTANEAYEKFKFIDGVVEGRSELLTTLGASEMHTSEPEVSWPEELARFLGGMVVSGLLISVAMLGLLMELYAPGKGIGGLVFLFGMGLFFWARFLGGQAGPFEVVFFLIGIAFLAIELFLIPGFGFFGFTGIGLVILSLVFSFLPPAVSTPGLPELPFPYGALREAILTVLAGFVAAAIGLLILGRYLPRAPLLKKLVLEAGAGAGVAAAADPAALAEHVGSRGVAHTDLRPAGKVEIAGRLLDAVTDSEFIEKGSAVEAIEASGNRVVVRLVTGTGPADGSAT